MNNSARIPAAEILVGDLITLYNGVGYRVHEVTPSASGKLIKFKTLVEVTSSREPDIAIGRPFTLGKQAGTMLTVERG